MAEDKIIQIDTVDAYNKLYGWETLHPLVTIVNHTETVAALNHSRLNYGLYALFLKQGDGCSIRYGREKYDYQEGSIVSFKPGQVVEVEWAESKPMPASRGLLLDYCMRYYDRQFITRHKVNSDIMTRFQNDLEEYFRSGEAERMGLPSVAYFAEKVFLSSGYFGDLIKKETGLTAQRYIQNKVIDLSKQYVMDKELTINQVAYKLGFQYPQHFTRLFKQQVGVTPTEYRN